MGDHACGKRELSVATSVLVRALLVALLGANANGCGGIVVNGVQFAAPSAVAPREGETSEVLEARADCYRALEDHGSTYRDYRTASLATLWFGVGAAAMATAFPLVYASTDDDAHLATAVVSGGLATALTATSLGLFIASEGEGERAQRISIVAAKPDASVTELVRTCQTGGE